MKKIVCDICGREERAKSRSGGIKRLAEDHCHNTGIYRGRLCQRCNTALGLFGDDIEILKSAIKYLKITPKQWDSINNKRLDEWWSVSSEKIAFEKFKKVQN